MSPNRLRRAGILGACLLSVGPAAGALAQAPQGAGRGFGVEVRNFDPAVRPQDDFFGYVNGGWLRATQIPQDRSSYGSFVELRDRSEEALRAIVEEAAAAPSRAPGSDAQKIGDFYLAVMDSAAIERQGLQPLRPELARIAGLADRGALAEHFAHLQRLGVQTPFSLFVFQDQKNATRYAAYVNQSGLGLPDREYYLQDAANFAQTRAAYTDYAATLLRLAGEPNPAGAARDILALETSLARGHWDRAKNRDDNATYNAYDPARLGEVMPGFAWQRYLAASGAAKSPVLVVRQPSYFQALDRVLAETPLHVWKSYLTFKLLDAYAEQLPAAYAGAHFAFRGRTLQGLQEQRPRWRRAVAGVEEALGEVAGRSYVERYFRPEQKARMQALVDNVVAAFRQGIDELEWMSPATRAQAKEKLSRFTVKIAYPDQWPDYSGLEVRAGDAAGNAMRASRFAFHRMVDRLGKPIDRSEWGMTPQTVNAYYSPTMNEIVFPAAILQPPFFDPEADDAVNYGAIGAVIGHEISHGFDDQGRRSDGEGNLRDWWTAADARAFEQRANRLVDQYAGFSPLQGLNVNGRLTLGENIGDLSGLAVAYKAYRLSLGGREAPVIDGFTGDQRFFLGWAQIWRAKYREEALRQQVLTNPHSPSQYRVNGVLRNMPEFYAAFGVKPGDGMYLPPEQRVKIW